MKIDDDAKIMVYQWIKHQPGVSDDFVHVPIESLAGLLVDAYGAEAYVLFQGSPRERKEGGKA